MDPTLAHRKAQLHRRATKSTTTTTTTTWCCSFKGPPKSPDTTLKKNHNVGPAPDIPGRARVDPRRILSPGRVSPIDPDPSTRPIPEPTSDADPLTRSDPCPTCEPGIGPGHDDNVGWFDVRLSLKGKDGNGFLVLEMNSKVLVENSGVFGGLVGEYCCNSSKESNGRYVCRIEVSDVENVGVFRDTIELMFEENEEYFVKKLINFGAFRVIDILEISSRIKFNRGVSFCLKYLEAVPWTEEEEEKLRRLFAKFKVDDVTSNELRARLNLDNSYGAQQKLAVHLVRSITSCANTKSRNDLKFMVKGLLSKSLVYDKNYNDITKEDLYSISQSCLSSLVVLFQDAYDIRPHEQGSKARADKPLIEQISWQVENINWLLEILLDRHMAEEFVDIWTSQKELLELHQRASPMVRYELSRVSVSLFVAMGTRKLQCRAQSRLGLLQSWFGPMLLDFGWLQRCRKGLDIRELEEAMGQALLTLPLKQQYELFMEWFKCFSKHGTECPNLSKAFQIWWRRSFLRDSEPYTRV